MDKELQKLQVILEKSKIDRAVMINYTLPHIQKLYAERVEKEIAVDLGVETEGDKQFKSTSELKRKYVEIQAELFCYKEALEKIRKVVVSPSGKTQTILEIDEIAQSALLQGKGLGTSNNPELQEKVKEELAKVDNDEKYFRVEECKNPDCGCHKHAKELDECQHQYRASGGYGTKGNCVLCGKQEPNSKDECPNCDGTGYIQTDVDKAKKCPKCNGTGLKTPEKKA